MRNAKMKQMKLHKLNRPGRGKWIAGSVCLVLLAMVAACIWYVNDYYHAEELVNAYLKSGNAVTVTQEDTMVILDGAGTEHAMIFYPGAKVEYTAYVPMFYALAERGVDCFVIKMSGNLAILDSKKAADIMEKYSYEHWYLAGHSLGGAMAANFAAEYGEELDGLLLLAAYPTKELPEDLLVLSVYGSEDKILNMESLKAGKEFMPVTYAELCISGGNHAWFGFYGEQDGDGTAKITKQEQQKRTVDAVMKMMIK